MGGYSTRKTCLAIVVHAFRYNKAKTEGVSPIERKVLGMESAQT